MVVEGWRDGILKRQVQKSGMGWDGMGHSISLMSITAALANYGSLWAEVCGRGQTALSSERVMPQHEQQCETMQIAGFTYLGSRLLIYSVV